MYNKKGTHAQSRIDWRGKERLKGGQLPLVKMLSAAVVSGTAQPAAHVASDRVFAQRCTHRYLLKPSAIFFVCFFIPFLPAKPLKLASSGLCLINFFGILFSKELNWEFKK